MLVLVCDNVAKEAWCEFRARFDTDAELSQTTRCYPLTRSDRRFVRFVALSAARILGNHPSGPMKDGSVIHCTMISMLAGAGRLLEENPSLFRQIVNIDAGQSVSTQVS